MLKLNDFILLKAIYNEEIHHAVLAKDKGEIEVIMHRCYSKEFQNGFVALEGIDTEWLHKEHKEQLADESLIRRLI